MRRILLLLFAVAGTSTFWSARALAVDSASLHQSVVTLPERSAAEKIKKAMLGVALERAKACEEANAAEDAAALLSDIHDSLNQSAATLAAASADKTHIAAAGPVRVAQGNPYIEMMREGAALDLAKPDVDWKKCTPALNVFNGLSGTFGTRDVAAQMESYLWLFANPASPYRGDAEILRRFLRRAHAYADAVDVHADTIKAGQSLFDDFAIAPASSSLREFATLFPNLLLPSQKRMWDRAMQKAGNVMWGKAKDRDGTYANIDLALAFELLNFGIYLKNDDMLAKSRFLIDAQAKNIYPDGGIAYLGHQNESHGYHDSCCRDLARYYEASGYEPCIDLLKRTEWFGPVSSGYLSEFWTVPSWKGTWNNNKAVIAGGEWVAAVTGNPLLRAMADAAQPAKGDPRHWPAARLQVAWYRNDVKPSPMPVNFTVIDRNICGPRAWYGRFNYAAQLRPIPTNEPGLATLMGCQVTEPGFSLNKAVMGVFPRVRVGRDLLTKEGGEMRQSWAWLTSGLKSSAAYGRSVSAVGGTYRLHAFGSSTKGPDSDWKAAQVWIGLPDRVIGLLTVQPVKEQATAWEVNGVVRLTMGGTALGSPKKIERLGANTFSYGDLVVKIHDHNYAKLQTNEIPFRLPKAPVTDIALIDDVSANAGDNKARIYPAGAFYFYVTEIRPSWARGDAKVTRLKSADGVPGLQVDLGGKRYAFWFNGSNSTVRIDLKSVAIPGVAASVRDTSAPNAKPVLTIPAFYDLPAGAGVMLVSSADAQDHLPGWENFQAMIAAPLGMHP